MAEATKIVVAVEDQATRTLQQIQRVMDQTKRVGQQAGQAFKPMGGANSDREGVGALVKTVTTLEEKMKGLGRLSDTTKKIFQDVSRDAFEAQEKKVLKLVSALDKLGERYSKLQTVRKNIQADASLTDEQRAEQTARIDTKMRNVKAHGTVQGESLRKMLDEPGVQKILNPATVAQEAAPQGGVQGLLARMGMGGGFGGAMGTLGGIGAVAGLLWAGWGLKNQVEQKQAANAVWEADSRARFVAMGEAYKSGSFERLRSGDPAQILALGRGSTLANFENATSNKILRDRFRQDLSGAAAKYKDTGIQGLDEAMAVVTDAETVKKLQVLRFMRRQEDAEGLLEEARSIREQLDDPLTKTVPGEYDRLGKQAAGKERRAREIIEGMKNDKASLNAYNTMGRGLRETVLEEAMQKAILEDPITMNLARERWSRAAEIAGDKRIYGDAYSWRFAQTGLGVPANAQLMGMFRNTIGLQGLSMINTASALHRGYGMDLGVAGQISSGMFNVLGGAGSQQAIINANTFGNLDPRVAEMLGSFVSDNVVGRGGAAADTTAMAQILAGATAAGGGTTLAAQRATGGMQLLNSGAGGTYEQIARERASYRILGDKSLSTYLLSNLSIGDIINRSESFQNLAGTDEDESERIRSGLMQAYKETYGISAMQLMPSLRKKIDEQGWGSLSEGEQRQLATLKAQVSGSNYNDEIGAIKGLIQFDTSGQIDAVARSSTTAKDDKVLNTNAANAGETFKAMEKVLEKFADPVSRKAVEDFHRTIGEALDMLNHYIPGVPMSHARPVR